MGGNFMRSTIPVHVLASMVDVAAGPRRPLAESDVTNADVEAERDEGGKPDTPQCEAAVNDRARELPRPEVMEYGRNSRRRQPEQEPGDQQDQKRCADPQRFQPMAELRRVADASAESGRSVRISVIGTPVPSITT